jgi:hypothetical protein
MSGAIPPLHQYAFMAWRLVGAQGQFWYGMDSKLRFNDKKIVRRVEQRETTGKFRSYIIRNKAVVCHTFQILYF